MPNQDTLHHRSKYVMIVMRPTAALMLNQYRTPKRKSTQSHLPSLSSSQVELSGNAFDNMWQKNSLI